MLWLYGKEISIIKMFMFPFYLSLLPLKQISCAWKLDKKIKLSHCYLKMLFYKILIYFFIWNYSLVLLWYIYTYEFSKIAISRSSRIYSFGSPPLTSRIFSFYLIEEFVVDDEKVSWSAARDHCQYMEGDLAMLVSQTVQDQALAVIPPSITGFLWIRLTDERLSRSVVVDG